uniref:8-oxoguanine DNA glycosylase/AP lyase n=1 Tax=Archaeoglobus fulgidus TaxID=2234 RepID=A0A7J2TJZ0_ARCFL
MLKKEKESLSKTSESIKCKVCRFEPPEFVLEAIRQRIKEFQKLGRDGYTRFKFQPFLDLEIDATTETELAFCISTANSSAKAGLRFQKMLEGRDIFSMSVMDFEELLKKSGVRFYRKKAVYIRDAIKKFHSISLPEDDTARDLLVKEISGFGYKEASHFLRNIGRENFAILDRHILEWLEIKQRNLSRKKYLEAEQKVREIASRLGKSVAELDLFIWSMKTGMVLK